MTAILPQPGYLSLKLIMPRRRLLASFFLVCRSSGLASGLALSLVLGVVISSPSLALVAQVGTFVGLHAQACGAAGALGIEVAQFAHSLEPSTEPSASGGGGPLHHEEPLF